MNVSRTSIRIEEFSSTLTYVELSVVGSILISICLLTIIGNALVLISFIKDKNLRTLSNYFILSLAVSDFMIGVFSMPLFIVYLLTGQWILGKGLCDMWLAQDYTCGNASFMNLLMISIDRYFSVTRPLKYRAKRTKKRVALMISCVWIISFLVWPPWIYAWPYIDGRRTIPEDDCYVQFLETNSYATIITAVVDYYIPVIIILVLYYKIWRATQNRNKYLADMESGYQAESISLQKCLPSSETSTKKELCKTSNYDQTSQKPDGVESDKDTEIPLLDKTTNSEGKSGLEIEKDDNESYALANNNIATADVITISGNNKLCKISDYDKTSQKPDGVERDNDTEMPLLNKTTDAEEESGLVTEKYDNESYASANNSIDTADVITITQNNIISPNKTLTTKKKPLKHESKAAKVLTAILLAFLVTTTPYNIVVIIKSFDKYHTIVPDFVWNFFYFLFYVNSTLNPLCYALANENFRRTYWQILTCSRRKKPQYNAGSSSNGSQSLNTSAKYMTSAL